MCVSACVSGVQHHDARARIRLQRKLSARTGARESKRARARARASLRVFVREGGGGAILSSRHLEINGRSSFSPPSLPENEDVLLWLPSSLPSSSVLGFALKPEHRF